MATGNASGDRTEALIATLDPAIQLRAVYLVNAARQAGVPLVITSARRSAAEQRVLVAAGRSNTLNSRHLDGRAFDVDVYGMGRDVVPDAFWQLLGPWAESNLGLRWGGRWRSPYDPGHFEF